MEHIGVALLDALSPEALGSDATCAMALEPEKDHATSTGKSSDQAIPAPLRAVVDVEFGKLDWKAQGAGISSYSVPVSEGASGALKLIMLDPGKQLPASKYDGEALLVVLDGRCEVQKSELTRGDYLEFMDGDTPPFTADSELGCILLLAEEGFAR